jgi:hypothetical protein
MPKATTCLLNNETIGIEDALNLRDEAKRGGQRLDFRCVSCRKCVRPHRDGGQAAAHFEYLERNAACPLSDPARD